MKSCKVILNWIFVVHVIFKNLLDREKPKNSSFTWVLWWTFWLFRWFSWLFKFIYFHLKKECITLWSIIFFQTICTTKQCQHLKKFWIGLILSIYKTLFFFFLILIFLRQSHSFYVDGWLENTQSSNMYMCFKLQPQFFFPVRKMVTCMEKVDFYSFFGTDKVFWLKKMGVRASKSEWEFEKDRQQVYSIYYFYSNTNILKEGK